MTTPTSFLHVLNLDTIGGVESLYIHFIQRILKERRSEQGLHHTIISGKRCHPIYQEVFSSLNYKPFHEQYVARIRLPKFLRFVVEIRRGMIESIIEGPMQWVFWNRIEESSPPQNFIYYEHGASWMIEPNEKRKNFIHAARKVIANSEAARILLSELWEIPRDSIAVVRNPLRPDIAIASTPRKEPNRPLQLGYIGRLTALKAPAVAIHTLHQLRTVQGIEASLTIAGEGTEKKFLIDLAKKLNLQEHVKCVGTLKSIDSFYDSIDMLIIPSIREPLGLVALEASARGVPVIAARVDGLYESVHDSQSGKLIAPTMSIAEHAKDFLFKKHGLPRVVVDPIGQKLVEPKLLDPAQCAQAIVDIMQMPGEYSRLSYGGIEHAQKQTGFETYVQRLIEELSISVPVEENEEADESSS